MKEEVLINELKNLGIEDLSSDSRYIEKNCAFFALHNDRNTKNGFVEEAMAKGARAIVLSGPPMLLKAESTRFFYVEDTRKAMVECGLAFYSNVPNKLALVTGTNGKTSVVHYYKQICHNAGYRAASVGTLGCEASHSSNDFGSTLGLTTPDFLSLRKILNKLAKCNVEHVGVEASSHGLEQGRLESTYSRLLCFTSFSQDHLDYHKSLEVYLESKLQLFRKHATKDACIAVSSEVCHLIPKDIKANHEILTIGINSGDIAIELLNSNLDLQTAVVDFQGKKFHLKTRIIGLYQLQNIMLAAALAYKAGVDIDAIFGTLHLLKSAPGRLQRVGNSYVFIDFAHNEDALKRVLADIHRIKRMDQRIWVVFGCGGGRDVDKREKMGLVAQEMADFVIVTDDNPRHEDPARIRRAILKGCRKASEVPDRAKAIHVAVASMQPSDVLLICGKGHEDYQIVGDQRLAFLDYRVAQTFLEKMSKTFQ